MKSNRLLSLPPYLFEELEKSYRDAQCEGRDIIDLSIGDPDLDPPTSLSGNIMKALRKDDHHFYPPQRGLPVLKEAVGRYISNHYGFKPSDEEVLILIGSKEGLAHLPLAICNAGDSVLVPDPGYPVYSSSSIFAGCKIVNIELSERLGFLPDFDSLDKADLEGVRLCFLNYPNNPTGAPARKGFFERALDFADSRGMILANDAAYAEIFFDDRPKLLSALPGSLRKKVIEFFSFSKMFCITGWRIGFAVGNGEIIEALAHLKANIDSGVFGAIQEAVAITLEEEVEGFVSGLRLKFRKRRDRAIQMIEDLGLECFHPGATFYLWVKVPDGWSSFPFAIKLLEKCNVLVAPGAGFGKRGEGYFRLALTCSVERLDETWQRLRKVFRDGEFIAD